MLREKRLCSSLTGKEPVLHKEKDKVYRISPKHTFLPLFSLPITVFLKSTESVTCQICFPNSLDKLVATDLNTNINHCSIMEVFFRKLF